MTTAKRNANFIPYAQRTTDALTAERDALAPTIVAMLADPRRVNVWGTSEGRRYVAVCRELSARI